MLMGPVDRGVDGNGPLHPAHRVITDLDVFQQLRPGPIRFPAGEPLVDGLPGAVPLGQIAPRSPRPQPPQHPVDHLPVITPRTTTSIHPRQQGLYPLPRRFRQLASTSHKINDQSARARTLARGLSRNGSVGRWSAFPGVRTACRSGSSTHRLRLPEDGATSYASPPGPESQRPLPTVPRPARCEQQAAAARPPAAAFFSPVLAPAQNHWLASGRQGNGTEHAHSR